jgi:hypothetical protein
MTQPAFRHLTLLLPALLLTACGDAPKPPVAAEAKPKPKAETAIAEFARGRLSTPSAHPEKGRPFGQSSAEDRALVDAALQTLSSSSSSEVEAKLTELRHIESAELLRVAGTLLQHSDADVRLNGLTLVEGYSDPGLLPLIQTAHRDSSADVRIEAMELAQYITSPTIQPILSAALQDTHNSVRHLALQSALKQDPAVQSSLLDSASASAYPDVAQAALAHTEASPKKSSIGRFFQALDHRDSTVRSQAHEALSLLLHQSFPSAQAAQSWWQKHATAFNDDLVLTDANLASQLAR